MIAHRIERFGPWMAAISVAMAFVIFALAGLYSFQQQNHVSARLCEANVINRRAIRVTWKAAEEFILIGESDPEARRAAREFFAAVLRPIPPLECVDNQPVPKEG